MILCGADVSGVWKTEYTSEDGTTHQSTFHLKANGGKLTGKIVGQSGEVEIKDGAVKGEDISFEVTRKLGEQEVRLKYTGKIEGNELKLKLSINGNSFDVVARRQGS
jgi:hypothetical protein